MANRPGHSDPCFSPWGRPTGAGGRGGTVDETAGNRPRRAYHHGRLKEALIEAARSLIERHGPQGFTLSEAAKLAGVTPAAPYRHFSDRDALMGEVATRGFEQFGARLAGAWDDGRPDATAALHRMGRAYLAFSREEPGFYFTMFGHRQRLSQEGSAAADRAFGALVQAGAAILRERRVDESGGRALAYEIWCLSHGVATLSLGRFLDASNTESDPARILESAVAAVIEQAVWTAGNSKKNPS